MLNFYTKTKSRCSKDVSVRLGKSSNSKYPTISFTFYNECYRRIGAEYATFAVEGNRIYFAPASEISGWKLSETSKTSKIARMLITTTDKNMFNNTKDFEGTYEFKFDKELGYWYIEREEMNNS